MNFNFLIARFFRSARHFLNLGVTPLFFITSYYNLFSPANRHPVWAFYDTIQVGRIPTLAYFINKNGLMDLVLHILPHLRPLYMPLMHLNGLHHGHCVAEMFDLRYEFAHR